MRTRNKLAIAIVCAAASVGATRIAPGIMNHRMGELIGTTVVQWDSLRARTGETGTVRRYFNAPTSTLLELGLRARTLAPGADPYPELPHSRVGEQIILVKEGTLEIQIDDKVHHLGPGSAVFLGPNQWHALRNPGNTAVTFYEFDWTSPGMNGVRQY